MTSWLRIIRLCVKSSFKHDSTSEEWKHVVSETESSSWRHHVCLMRHCSAPAGEHTVTGSHPDEGSSQEHHDASPTWVHHLRQHLRLPVSESQCTPETSLRIHLQSCSVQLYLKRPDNSFSHKPNKWEYSPQHWRILISVVISDHLHWSARQDSFGRILNGVWLDANTDRTKDQSTFKLSLWRYKCEI